MLTEVRAFLSSRSVLEVDTPLLGRFAITDPNIELFEVATSDGTRFLQSSPEYHDEATIASGSGDIFQLGKVFRSGEHGGRHNPEFVMLEWYRVDWTHYQLMREVAELIAGLCGFPHGKFGRSKPCSIIFARSTYTMRPS